MSQTGYTPISIYYSATASNVPTAGNLVAGELAINTADGRLFYKDSAGVVQVIAGKGGAGVAGGSNTQVQYNSSGSLAGSANMTFNGTALTLANDASISGLTVGKGGGASTLNTVVGLNAFVSNTTGIANSAFGQLALNASNGDHNSAFGRTTLYVNTSGVRNSAFGSGALEANTTGGYNTAIGSASLALNTTASNNTAVGYQAGYSNTTGTRNTYIGYQAGKLIATNSYNCMVGSYAGTNCLGSTNTFIGDYAGGNATTGVGNTFLGQYSGGDVTTGSKNTIIGAYGGNQGGLDIRTANNYIVLSDGDGNPRGYFDGNGAFFVGAFSNTGASYGFSFQPAGSLGLISGTGTSSQAMLRFYNGNGGVGGIFTSGTSTSYNTSSDYRLKENITPITGALDKVSALKPVNYKWKADGSNGEGFIAHELAEVCPDAVTGTKDAVDEDGKPVYQGIDTSFLVATLVAAIQEQQTLITDLQARLAKAGL